MCNHLIFRDEDAISNGHQGTDDNLKLDVNRREFERIRWEWDLKMAAEYNAIEESQRIRGEDMNIIVY